MTVSRTTVTPVATISDQARSPKRSWSSGE
jgi:hypothetical protein